jgi:hypothetical protein
MTTDFRADLPQWTEGVCGDGAAILRDGVMVPIEEVIARLNQAEARAALSAPVQGPTDEDLYDLANDCDLDRLEGERSCPDGVVVKEGCWEAWDHQLVAFARALLTRWGRPAVELVPVTERLPGPEDCDAKGRCWWLFEGSDDYEPCWTLRKMYGIPFGRTRYLPHWALPVPQEGPMADLSPAANAVREAFNDVAERVGVFEDYGDALAAFTRALADRMMNLIGDTCHSKYEEGIEAASDFVERIADELES